jgi:FlaA1/EpsC-like NDP-sugar epimerase
VIREFRDDRWERLLNRPRLDLTTSPRNLENAGKTILVTGAGGYIGSALAKAIAASNPLVLIAVDHSEHNLHRVSMELRGDQELAPHVAILGDVCDGALLTNILERYRPEIIYHAAAFKHVPLLETNPLAAIRNNVIGTYRLAQAAVEQKVAKLLLISTDKAVNPQSVMGASKRIAELALLRWSNTGCEMKVVRLGNVLGSPGSVAPLFLEQILGGGPVTVTHSDVNRYFLTLDEAVELIRVAASIDGSEGIYVPELGEPIKILDLARHLIGAFNACIRCRDGGIVRECVQAQRRAAFGMHSPHCARVHTKRHRDGGS